jgi:hypothetical protein
MFAGWKTRYTFATPINTYWVLNKSCLNKTKKYFQKSLEVVKELVPLQPRIENNN